MFPKSGDFNLNLNITGYTTICNAYQPNKRGVCIFVHSRLSTFKDDHLSAIPFSEYIWCHIPLESGDCLLLGVIYRSPNSDLLNFEHLCSLLTSANNSGCSHLLITGDFNMPHISWTALNVSPPCSISEAFLALLEDLYIF